MNVESLLRARAEIGDLDESRQVLRMDCQEAHAIACFLAPPFKTEAGREA